MRRRSIYTPRCISRQANRRVSDEISRRFRCSTSRTVPLIAGNTHNSRRTVCEYAASKLGASPEISKKIQISREEFKENRIFSLKLYLNGVLFKYHWRNLLKIPESSGYSCPKILDKENTLRIFFDAGFLKLNFLIICFLLPFIRPKEKHRII